MNNKIAFVFPGQGSQFIGMGKDFFIETGTGRDFFKKADLFLNRQLSNICFEGPEEELKITANTQPGLFVCSVMVFEYLKSNGIEPIAVAGHSLGEYSALYASGVFDFEEGLHLVRERGKAMSESAENQPGAMAAIIGLSIEKVEEICKELSDYGIVKPANYNSPEQLVISGDSETVLKAIEMAKQKGAKRAIMLPVQGAFHSPLMDSAYKKMVNIISEANFQNPTVDFVCNADAKILREIEMIKDSLSRQIISCVKWVDSINLLVNELGINLFIEVGPGKVLSGLIKRICPGVKCLNCGTVEEAKKIIQERDSI